MPEHNSLSMLGEFGLIGMISSRFPQPERPELGIGDDGAILNVSPGMQLVVSTDLLAEGVHFDRGFGSPYLLGRKTLAVNLSDLAAMGAVPRWFFLSLAIPAGFPLQELEGFLDGLAEQAAVHNCLLAGGDTCSSKRGLVISVTIMGEQQPEYIVKRSGASPGDEIWASGTLGDSAFGLSLLLEDKVSGDAEKWLAERHLNPSPRMELGRMLAESGAATAMIDISDGLLADLGHICNRSGCGAEIILSRLPLSDRFLSVAQKKMDFPWHLAATGGEDYELCFTATPDNHHLVNEISKTAGIPATVIGKVTCSGKVDAWLPDNSIFKPAVSGYRHF